MKIILGATYKDKITGFSGVATGHVRYITGCDQVLLSPRAKSGTKPNAEWFDHIRVDQVGKKVVKIKFANDASELNDRGADIEAPRK